VNNFASSVQRSVDFLSKSFDSKLASPLLRGRHESIPDDLDTILVPDENATLHSGYGSTILNVPGVSDYVHAHTHSHGGIFNDTLSITSAHGGDIRIIKSNDDPESIIKVVSLKSTPVQTIFNSINVLIGLGILSIPLALHLSGWILGVACLTFAALSTKQTAVLLGRILQRYPHLGTYQDIGIHCFGQKIGFVILIIFTLDLLGAGISMILLFSDSLNALAPETFSKFSLKVFVTSLLVVLNFLPLRLLSFLSLLGILCTTATCVTIGVAGLLKDGSPGSLLHPLPTNLYPTSLIDFFFALGLYMAPWGGHATFPEIYKDQLEPRTYGGCMNISFSFSYLMDLTTGVLGFIMFGELVDDEITKNILTTEGYPTWMSTLIVALMGILPISKLPLICRPITTILDSRFGHSHSQKLINRVGLSIFYFLAATLLTDFGKVMSLLGSLICFTVCLTLPCLYYLHVFNDELSGREKAMFRALVVIGAAGAVGGTIAVVLR
jgi:vesicular inhibitory amino acid transporter